MEGELEVQPVRVELHQPANQAICLDGLSRIARMLDRRGEDAAATRHPCERGHYVGCKNGTSKWGGTEIRWLLSGSDIRRLQRTTAHGNGCKFRRISGWRAARSRRMGVP